MWWACILLAMVVRFLLYSSPILFCECVYERRACVLMYMVTDSVRSSCVLMDLVLLLFEQHAACLAGSGAHGSGLLASLLALSRPAAVLPTHRQGRAFRRLLRGGAGSARYVHSYHTIRVVLTFLVVGVYVVVVIL